MRTGIYMAGQGWPSLAPRAVGTRPTLKQKYLLGYTFEKPTVLRFRDKWVVVGPGLPEEGEHFRMNIRRRKENNN